MTRVSVIIPTYNRKSTIPRAIDSVLNQTVEDIEVIVVDDGSTDETWKSLIPYEDDRIYYIYQKNFGANVARNTGLRLAKGKIISFLDSDDELKPTYLEECIKLLNNSSSNCLGAATGYIRCSPNEKSCRTVPQRELDLSDFENRNPIGSFSCFTFNRKVLETVGYLDESLPSTQDYDYYIQIARKHKIACTNQALVIRYSDNDNRIGKNLSKKIEGQEIIAEKHPDVISSARISKHHISRGEILFANGRTSEANKEFLKAIRSSPYNIRGYYHLVNSFGKSSYSKILNLK